MKARERVFPVGLEPLREIRTPVLQLSSQAPEGVTGLLVALRLVPDPAQSAVEVILERLGRLLQRVHQKVPLASLPQNAWEVRPPGLREPGVRITRDELDAPEPSLDQAGKESRPARRRLAGNYLDAQDAPVPLRADCDQHRHVDDSLVDARS